MSRSDVWMPLHIGDYLSDTMRLTTIQHGAYLLLLMQYWKTGPLPDDEGELAGIVKMEPKAWAKIAPTIRRFFTVEEDGLMHQKRADAERAKASLISQKRRDAVAQRPDRKAAQPQQQDDGGGSNGGSSGQQDDNNRDTNVVGLKARLNTHARTELQSPSNQGKEEPPYAPLAEATPQAARQKTRVKRSQLPQDWVPSQAERDYAVQHQVDPDATALDFRDYWIGHGKPMADWHLTWQRWCRTAQSRAGMRGRSGSLQPRENPAERRIRETREAIHRMTYPELYADEPSIDHEPQQGRLLQ